MFLCPSDPNDQQKSHPEYVEISGYSYEFCMGDWYVFLSPILLKKYQRLTVQQTLTESGVDVQTNETGEIWDGMKFSISHESRQDKPV